jgi:hypothetical protein
MKPHHHSETYDLQDAGSALEKDGNCLVPSYIGQCNISHRKHWIKSLDCHHRVQLGIVT